MNCGSPLCYCEECFPADPPQEESGYLCQCGEGSLTEPPPRWCPACGTYFDPAEEREDMADVVELFTNLLDQNPETPNLKDN